MNKLKLLIAFLLITILHRATFADTLIDTGTPTNTSTQWSFHGNPTSEVWYAGLFSLDQSYFLTDISLYLTPRYAGTVTVSIYPGDVVPVVGSELLSDTFLGTAGGPTGWYGVSDLDWEVSSGSYWVAFEAREKDYYYSTLPSATPSPMDAYASYNPSLGGWNLTGDLGIGMRISGEVVPLPISVTVDIDIKPGSYPNSINPNAGGVIPVAILTTDTLDASTVDPATVTLEGANAKGKGKSGNVGSLEDVDGDGDLDLIVQVVNDINWAVNATEATLTGMTYDGISIEGTDSVRIVPPEPVIIETVTVYSNDIDGEDSTTSLLDGVDYRIEVSGTWTNRTAPDAFPVDAEYVSYDGWISWQDGPDPTPDEPERKNQLDLQVDQTFVDWGTYSSDHTYSLDLVGYGSTVNFRVYDGLLTVGPEPGWYSDNDGSLTVAIYQLP